MSVFAAIHREIVDADMALVKIAYIRVTRDAIPGSVVTTPITPERLLPDDGWALDDEVGETLEALLRPDREIVVHPEDWCSLLAECDALGYAVSPVGMLRAVRGIPVYIG